MGRSARRRSDPSARGDALIDAALHLDGAAVGGHADVEILGLSGRVGPACLAGAAIDPLRESHAGHLARARQDLDAPTLGDEDAAIRWSWPTERVLRHIRAFAPSPGAWTEIDGKMVVLLEAEKATRFPAALEPGEGFSEKGRAVIRTGDGAIFLGRGEIDGAPASAEDLAELFLPPEPLLG